MTAIEESIVSIPRKKIKAIVDDPEKSAAAVNLKYVSDCEPGILRIKKGSNYQFLFKGKPVEDDETLLRIKQLVIPPAWKDVWICPLKNGHLQVTGLDARERKQYKYHELWTALRNHTKFFRLYNFGLALPSMRLKIESDLSAKGLPLRKVLATVVSLMELTNIRVGNNSYEKMYGSYGITTLKDKHVKINGSSLKFSFKGKKGVYHNVSTQSKRLARIVKQCRDIPGKELFQYYDENGSRSTIDSGMVNEYIREISKGDFTAKDFRTWTGSVKALIALRELGMGESEAHTKRNIVAALDVVSALLGNTRTVCRKYYVHPTIISLYESNGLSKYLGKLDGKITDVDKTGLSTEEVALMKILKSTNSIS